jgi:hypothetical protein
MYGWAFIIPRGKVISRSCDDGYPAVGESLCFVDKRVLVDGISPRPPGGQIHDVDVVFDSTVTVDSERTVTRH